MLITSYIAFSGGTTVPLSRCFGDNIKKDLLLILFAFTLCRKAAESRR
jgi:hypothetical protein